MKGYKQMNYPLTHNVKVYVPSTVDVDSNIDNSKYVEFVLSSLSKLFGGSTAYQTKGGWISDSKGLVIEDVTIVESFMDSDSLQKNLQEVEKLGLWLKNELSQEAVSIQVDNKLGFI